MKRFFVSLVLLMSVAFTFAEPKFFGVSFNITESEKNEVSKELESRVVEALSPFALLNTARAPKVSLSFNRKDKKLDSIKIIYASEYYIADLMYAYLLDNGYKLLGSKVYNDDFLITITSSTIEICERKRFNDAMKSLN